MLQPDLTYQLLRNLTSPVVAITSVRGGKENGMISDAAVRASIVPTVPRLSVYIHKFNYSHDMIFETGRFGLHLLHTRQFEIVRRLGFFSGRDQEKLAGIPHHPGTLGVPVLDECFAHFECSVANVMDTGSSTLFLGDVVAVGCGAAAGLEPKGELMTATYFRSSMPAEWRIEYEAKLGEAQRVAALALVGAGIAIASGRGGDEAGRGGLEDGQVVDFFSGALPENHVRQWLEGILAASHIHSVRRIESQSPAEAERQYREILSSSPHQPQAKLGLARVLHALGRHDDSAQLLRELEDRALLEAEGQKLKAQVELQGKESRDLDSRRAAAQAPSPRPSQSGIRQPGVEQFMLELRVGLGVPALLDRGLGRPRERRQGLACRPLEMPTR